MINRNAQKTRHKLLLTISCIALLCLGGCSNPSYVMPAKELVVAADKEKNDNPIDMFFYEIDDRNDGTTVTINVVSAQYCSAWQNEMRNMADVIRTDLTYDEDKNRVSAYLETVETQAEQMEQMTLFICASKEEPPETRRNTSGTIYNSMMSLNQAQIYKDAFFQLKGISRYYDDDEYAYCFDAALLDGFR